MNPFAHWSINFELAENLHSRNYSLTFVCMGDDAFPLTAYMMKPYPLKNLSLEKRIFNYRLLRLRRISENAFGILANHWRVFRKPFLLEPEKVNYTQPTFQRWINVVSTLWINVEKTLIWRWKWNKIRRRIFHVAQRWYNVSARRWNNAGTTLIQCCFNLVSTLVKTIFNPVGLVMIMDLKIHE